MRTYAATTTLLALTALPPMLTDAATTTLLALTALPPMLTDAGTATLLAHPALPPMLAAPAATAAAEADVELRAYCRQPLEDHSCSVATTMLVPEVLIATATARLVFCRGETELHSWILTIAHMIWHPLPLASGCMQTPVGWLSPHIASCPRPPNCLQPDTL